MESIVPWGLILMFAIIMFLIISSIVSLLEFATSPTAPIPIWAYVFIVFVFMATMSLIDEEGEDQGSFRDAAILTGFASLPILIGLGIGSTVAHHHLVVEHFYNNFANVETICGNVAIHYKVSCAEECSITLFEIYVNNNTFIQWEGPEDYAAFGNYPPFTQNVKELLIDVVRNCENVSNCFEKFGEVILFPKCVTIGRNIYGKYVLINFTT